MTSFNWETCPWCDGKVKMVSVSKDPKNKVTPNYYVMCQNCHTRLYMRGMALDCAKHWNMRAQRRKACLTHSMTFIKAIHADLAGDPGAKEFATIINHENAWAIVVDAWKAYDTTLATPARPDGGPIQVPLNVIGPYLNALIEEYGSDGDGMETDGPQDSELEEFNTILTS